MGLLEVQLHRDIVSPHHIKNLKTGTGVSIKLKCAVAQKY
jgi:hypothetical protein